MTQFTTDLYYILRKVVVGEATDQNLSPEIVQELQAHRCEVLNDKASPQKFQEAGLHVWNTLAKLPEDGNPFALPPRYDAEFIKEEFPHAMRMLHCLLTQRKVPGDHRIYYGLEGTGKTMFLHVVGAIAACLLETTLPIYWTYENSSDHAPPTPEQLIQAATRLVACGGRFGDHLSDVEESKEEPSEMLMPAVLLLDEFTTIYYPQDSQLKDVQTKRVQGQQIMHELVLLGKRQNTMVMLAASRHNVDRYVHPSRQAEFGTYPDLNNSIYMSRAILPLRDHASIRNYIEQRYGVRVSTSEAKDCFHRTGGVGRWMANWFVSWQFKPDNCVGKIISNPRLFRLCVQMISTTGGIPYSTAVELLDGDVRLLEQCCDEMIFVYESHRVHFVCPVTAEDFKSSLPSVHEFHCATVLHLTHRGFQDGSAGCSKEWLFSNHLHKFFELDEHDERDNISIINGTTTFELTNDQQFDVERYCGKLIKLVGEEGIDGFWLELMGENTLALSALQLKTGREGLKITAGKLTTQRRNRREGKKVDDRTIAGILVKAEHGFAKFVNAFAAQMSRLTTPKQIQLGQFCVFTDKESVSFEEFSTLNHTTQEEQKGSDDGAEFDMDNALQLSAGNRSFVVEVHDYNSKWVQTMLPRELLHIAYPTLA